MGYQGYPPQATGYPMAYPYGQQPHGYPAMVKRTSINKTKWRSSKYRRAFFYVILFLQVNAYPPMHGLGNSMEDRDRHRERGDRGDRRNRTPSKGKLILLEHIFHYRRD